MSYPDRAQGGRRLVTGPVPGPVKKEWIRCGHTGKEGGGRVQVA